MPSLTPHQILFADTLREAADKLGTDEKDRVLAALRAGNTHRAGLALRKAYNSRIQARTREMEELEGELEEMQRVGAAYDDLKPWAASPRLERAEGSLWQECCSGPVMILDATGKRSAPELKHNSVAYVVEHDWAAALSKAEEFATGEYRLPHDHCCFEFQISGKRVCVAVSGTDGQAEIMCPLIKSAAGWARAFTYHSEASAWRAEDLERVEDELAAVIGIIASQIRAICVALEAEVVASDVVRVPHKLNSARAKIGLLPVYDYHILSLAHRKRAPLPIAGAMTGDEKRQKRMHFRRGHWRHFTDHKTWIKWMLVGNPDLGFIDKHYRL